jgi:hypothetical protein
MNRLDVAAEEAGLRADLGLLLEAARAVQWSVPSRPSLENDTAERSTGGHSDPTPAIALDERRLELRYAVRYAETALKFPWLRSLAVAKERLSWALEPYGVAL